MSKLKCRPLVESEFVVYDELIKQQGTVFAQRKWLSIFDTEFTLLGLFNGGDQLIGTLPVHVTRKYGLPILLRSPFTPYNGPYFSADLKSSTRLPESRRFFLSEIVTYISKQRLAICCLPLDPACNDCLPFRWSGYKVVPSYTYRIPLSQSENEINANFSSTRRRNIRAALRDSLEIKPLDTYEIIESLAHNTFDRQGKQLSDQMTKRILYDFASPENSFGFAAFKSDEPIAGVFCIFDKQTAYYLIGGYDASQAHHGAGAACMQEAILKSKSLGLKTFDFEGSVIPPIERYFRGFGGELTPYFTANRAWFPIEMLLKFRKRELF